MMKSIAVAATAAVLLAAISTSADARCRGCAVGAGITGASVFALTAWIVLIGMWLGAGLTDLIVDRGFPAQASLTVNGRRPFG